MLFPFVIAMLYAAAVYGMVFFSQYRLQNVVDRAVATALYVDRSATREDQLETEVLDQARNALTGLLAALPGPLKNTPVDNACEVETVGGSVEMLRCSVTYNYKDVPVVPTMSFGMLGTFPPVPDELTAEAYTAF